MECPVEAEQQQQQQTTPQAVKTQKLSITFKSVNLNAKSLSRSALERLFVWVNHSIYDMRLPVPEWALMVQQQQQVGN